MKTIILIIIAILLGCNKSSPPAIDYTDKILDSAKLFIPEKINYSKVGLLKDSIKVKILVENDDCRFYSFFNHASYFIVRYKNENIRILSPCNLPNINDSTEYLISQDTATFVPTPALLAKYELPDYGNVPEYEDTAKIKTIFGKMIYKKRSIPSNLQECLGELDTILDTETKKNIFDHGVSGLHFGLGMWIRNNWRLWGHSKLQKYFMAQGIQHPDDMTAVILTEYQKQLIKANKDKN